MHTIGSSFGVSRFSQLEIRDRFAIYEQAIAKDDGPEDNNKTREQVEFSHQGQKIQVILEDKGVMARALSPDGQTTGIERGGVDDLEVATKGPNGYTAQIAVEDPSSGDGWYTPRSMDVTDQANPEQAFANLNEMFEAKWKMA